MIEMVRVGTKAENGQKPPRSALAKASQKNHPMHGPHRVVEYRRKTVAKSLTRMDVTGQMPFRTSLVDIYMEKKGHFARHNVDRSKAVTRKSYRDGLLNLKS